MPALPDSEQIPSVKYNPRQPHDHTMHKIDGRWRRTLEQDTKLFDRGTGVRLEFPGS